MGVIAVWNNAKVVGRAETKKFTNVYGLVAWPKWRAPRLVAQCWGCCCCRRRPQRHGVVLKRPLAPVLGVVSGLACAFFSKKGNAGMAFVSSALFIAGVILTAGFSMFPFLMPSITMPQASLTVWDATSSRLTLNVMFIVACFFVPIVLSYTAYSFYVMRGRIKNQD